MSWVFCGAVQLKNEGNSNVEAANQPGVSSVFGDYPEILGPALESLPAGRPPSRLPAAQGARLRHLHAEDGTLRRDRIPVFKSVKPWVKVEFYNLLNNDKLIKWDTTVTADPNSAEDANGLATGYIQGVNFGKATNDNQFPQPIPGTNGGRLFRMALGIRF